MSTQDDLDGMAIEDWTRSLLELPKGVPANKKLKDAKKKKRKVARASRKINRKKK